MTLRNARDSVSSFASGRAYAAAFMPGCGATTWTATVRSSGGCARIDFSSPVGSNMTRCATHPVAKTIAQARNAVVPPGRVSRITRSPAKCPRQAVRLECAKDRRMGQIASRLVRPRELRRRRSAESIHEATGLVVDVVARARDEQLSARERE